MLDNYIETIEGFWASHPTGYLIFLLVCLLITASGLIYEVWVEGETDKVHIALELGMVAYFGYKLGVHIGSLV